jgi:hypothetical protein
MKWWMAWLALGAPLLAGAETPPAAQEAEAAVFAPEVDVARSWQGVGTVEYVVRHKLHTVHGVSRQVEVRAVADGTGLKVMGRAPVRSFDSGNSNRDAHVLEVVRADQNPFVVLRGLAKGFRLPKGPGSFTVPLETEVQLAGVSSPVRLTAQVEQLASGDWKVSFAFDHRLSAHSIERPKLLLIPVDDEIAVRGEVLLEAVHEKK